MELVLGKLFFMPCIFSYGVEKVLTVMVIMRRMTTVVIGLIERLL